MIHSIQSGEATGRLVASPDAVQAYVETANDDVLECRVRGHRWPFTKKRKGFTGYSLSTNLFVYRVRCRCCQLVERVEYWEAKRAGKNHTLFERVAVELDYSVVGDDGQRYLLDKGEGHMSRRQLDEAVMTMSLAAKDLDELIEKTPRQIRKR